MKKWFIFFTIFFFVVGISFFSYLYLYRAEFTATALSKLFGTPVQVTNIRVTGKDIELQRVTVYNPAEYTMQPALSTKKILLKMSPLQVVSYFLGFNPTIRRIEIIDSTVSIDETTPDTNWSKLIANLKSQSDSTSHQCRVKNVIVRDLALDIKNKALHKHTKHLESIYEIVVDLPADADTPESIIYHVVEQTLREAKESAC